MGKNKSFNPWDSKKCADTFRGYVKSVKNTFKRHLEEYYSIKNNAEQAHLLLKSYDERVNNYILTIKELEQSNEQLIQEAVKKSENEERMRNLVTHLSHEFKAPLGIISGFLEIIEDGYYEKDPSYYTATMANEIEKLNTLVLETIELSKLETDNNKLTFEIFDASILITEIVDRFEKQFNDKLLQVKLNLEKAMVIGDTLKIEQVIVNLLSNAIKYSPKDEYIVITTRKINQMLHVFVKNEGVTIEEKELPHIWDRFYRVEKLRSNNSEGTGLGLAIVKKILDLHQSTYGIYNEGNAVVINFTLELMQSKDSVII